MKNIQISIVGEQPGGAIQGLRVPPPFDRLVLLHGDSSSSRDAASKVKEVAGAMVASDEIELIQVDPFGMGDVLNNVTKVRIYDPDATITVNLSGGTNIMASAALLGCFIIGADAFYIKFKKGEVEGPLEDRLVHLPIPRVRLDDVKGSKLKILQLLVGRKGAALTQGELAYRLNMSPQLVSIHVKQLAKWRLVTVSSEGRTNYLTLTDSGRLFAQISK
ncbi:MAG: hypothetical protein JRN68_06980 [Nitrososphaerota archaeon]|nr:hypothetical protein [Nitrososphaerota archaeon]